MTKQEVIKDLEKNNISYKLENSIIFIYIEDYCEENITKIKNQYKDYNRTIGFRPKEQFNNNDKGE